MKTFIYSYKKNNQIFRTKFHALNLPQARAILKEKKIIPLTLKEESSTSIFKRLFSSKTVQPDQIVIFSQLFSGAIRAGLTVKDSLSMLAKQVQNPILQSKIADIIVEIDSGTALSASFGKHVDIFPKFYPMLLKAGEAAGNLGDVLDYIGSYLERIDNLRKEIKGIFTYPAVVSSMCLALLVLILLFVAPTFKGVFIQAKMKLPVPTIILFAMSDILKGYYILLILLVLVIFLGSRLFLRSKEGRKVVDRFLFHAPLLGPIVTGTLMLRFVKTLDILVNNNVPILQALQILEEGTQNLYLKDIITQMRRDVSKGMPIAGALFEYQDTIPPLVAYAISMGEKSGRLGETLSRISNFIDKELTFSIKKLSSRLDPILTLSLGGVVLFIALSIYLPIFDMITATAL